MKKVTLVKILLIIISILYSRSLTIKKSNENIALNNLVSREDKEVSQENLSTEELSKVKSDKLEKVEKEEKVEAEGDNNTSNTTSVPNCGKNEAYNILKKHCEPIAPKYVPK